jgi:hypothetical protein
LVSAETRLNSAKSSIGRIKGVSIWSGTGENRASAEMKQQIRLTVETIR